MMAHLTRGLAAVVLALGLAAAPAVAAGRGSATADPPPAPPSPELKWQFQVMPYVWASGMGGTLRPFTGAPTVAFSKSFSDTLEDLDFAFFVAGSAERGRFVLLGDLSRVVTSRDGLVPPGLPASGRVAQSTLTLAAGYKAVVNPTSSLDVFAGFRAFRFDVDVAVAGVGSASPRRSFVDPILGVRYSAMLAPQWSAVLYADVGGFGAGTALTVVASALVNYHIDQRTTFTAGYRAMWIDYDDRGTLADVTVGGPIIGISWRF